MEMQLFILSHFNKKFKLSTLVQHTAAKNNNKIKEDISVPSITYNNDYKRLFRIGCRIKTHDQQHLKCFTAQLCVYLFGYFCV